MKKKAIIRGLLGFPLGVFIGYTITILVSLIWAQGYYSAVTPDLVSECGSEINAVILQFFMEGILGTAFAAGSVVWENDDWSLLKQTVVHFFIGSFAMLPAAYFLHWMEHTLIGFMSYFSIFIAIYAGIWAVQYAIWKKKINDINMKLKKIKNVKKIKNIKKIKN